jgi:hypothetical protein
MSFNQRPYVFSHVWNTGQIQIQAILFIFIEIYTKHVSKSGTGREDQRMRKKEGKKCGRKGDERQ